MHTTTFIKTQSLKKNKITPVLPKEPAAWELWPKPTHIERRFVPRRGTNDDDDDDSQRAEGQGIRKD